MTCIHIGHDISLIEEGASADSACVYVETINGQVDITCSWGAGWAGYEVVHDCDDADEAEKLARAIAADPVAELTRLGYDHAGWFKPAN